MTTTENATTDAPATPQFPRALFAMLAARIASDAAEWAANTLVWPDDMVELDVVQRFCTLIRARADRIEAGQEGARPPAPRPEVAAFAALMERELRANDELRGRAGWKDMPAAELLRMLDVDAAKLRFALGSGDTAKIIEQCADVANMAMMIADVSGGLAPAKEGG